MQLPVMALAGRAQLVKSARNCERAYEDGSLPQMEAVEMIVCSERAKSACRHDHGQSSV